MMKKKRLIALLVVLVLVVGSILIRVINLDDNTTYIPFSGRIFDFEAHEVSDLFLQNGTTGVNTTEADTQAVTDALNGLRSWLWFPDFRFWETGGWSYRAALVDGSVQKSFYFSDSPIPYISVNGIIYILSGEQVDNADRLCRLRKPCSQIVSLTNTSFGARIRLIFQY